MSVSMKSGLEGRNNQKSMVIPWYQMVRLNEVRPRRPEQSDWLCGGPRMDGCVSMKSGLEGRNNSTPATTPSSCPSRLNEVRPRRPEQ